MVFPFAASQSFVIGIAGAIVEVRDRPTDARENSSISVPHVENKVGHTTTAQVQWHTMSRDDVRAMAQLCVAPVVMQFCGCQQEEGEHDDSPGGGGGNGVNAEDTVVIGAALETRTAVVIRDTILAVGAWSEEEAADECARLRSTEPTAKLGGTSPSRTRRSLALVGAALCRARRRRGDQASGGSLASAVIGRRTLGADPLEGSARAYALGLGFLGAAALRLASALFAGEACKKRAGVDLAAGGGGP